MTTNNVNPVIDAGDNSRAKVGLFDAIRERATSDVRPFVFGSEAVRVVVGDGEPLFVARDVASTLGYSDADQAVRQHCKAAQTCPVEMTGQVRHVKVIPERDVYRLAFRSKLPAAEKFEEWVFGEVLPSIRTTGGYAATASQPTLPDFADPVAAARAWADAKESEQRALAITQQQAVQLEEQKAAVEFVKSYVAADGPKGFRQVCQLLNVPNEREFADWLIAAGIMYRLQGRLVPMANQRHTGRFVIKAGVTNDENAYAFNQTRFTPKGIEWIAGLWAARCVAANMTETV